MVLNVKLTGKQQDILNILSSADTWLDRSEIAQKLGRNVLNPHDKETLSGLVELSLIERSTELSGITEKYIYRITS